MQALDIARQAALAAVDKKAKHLITLDMRGQTDMCDLQLICSGDSDKQTKAISQAIEDSLKRNGIVPFAIEGKQTGNWVLIDFGSVLVHVFSSAIRDFYSIEKIWPKAKPVDLGVKA